MSVINILRYPFVRFKLYWLNHLIVRCFPRYYVKKMYRQLFAKELDIDNPKTYNEWIQWAKFNSNTSRWAELSDKYLVRGYIKECGLDDMLVKLYGVWENPESISWDSLPDSFILKTNNGSGTNLIVRDKSKLDIGEAKRTLKNWIQDVYGYRFAELHYLSIKPMIIAEELLDCNKQVVKTNSLIDYKFFCASGEPLCILAIWDRDKDSFKCAVYDINWTHLPNTIRYNSHYRKPDKLLPVPQTLDQMVAATRILAAGFPEVRVDLYEVDNKPLFGEMTFTSAGGFMDYFTDEFCLQLGNKIKV